MAKAKDKDKERMMEKVETPKKVKKPEKVKMRQEEKVGIHSWTKEICTMHCSKSFQDLIAYSFHILGV